MSELGVIPSDENECKRSRRLKGGSALQTAGKTRAGDPGTTAFAAGGGFPGGAHVDPFLCTAGYAAPGSALSSAAPSEGKTSVLNNLSIALAQAGQRVLLIDGDMRHPRMHQIFDIENSAGLSEVLAGKTTLTIRETKVPNLVPPSRGK